MLFRSQSQPQPDTGKTADTAQLWQQLQAESQRSGCDQDSQCHSLGVGAKACGGPERYLAWSDRQRSDQRLQQLAARYAAARIADDQREQMMSNCAVVADPGAVCRAGRCELRSLDPPARAAKTARGAAEGPPGKQAARGSTR